MDIPEALDPQNAADATPSQQEAKPLDRYECRACGYIYEPEKGDNSGGILSDTPFEELPVTWRCPVCAARAAVFTNIGPSGTASGFKENFGYGLGVNTLTPLQKSLLIFGGLLVGFLMMLSLYGLN
jgi:rubredoxin